MSSAPNLPGFVRPACAHPRESPPSVPDKVQYIHFRHPGYGPGYDLMFRMHALDRESTDTDAPAHDQRWGLHHATALRICTIIACNEEGFLSPTKLDPDTGISDAPSLHAVLTAPSYWFYPYSWGLEHAPYPVCPNFENWQFPSDAIPTDWISIATGRYEGTLPAPSQFSRAVNERDATCRISNFSEMTQVAHLVPRDERDWFVRNLMYNFNLNVTLSNHYVTCDLANCFRLRQDLHTLFDSKAFVLVPKHGFAVVHFLSKGANYCKEYHNRTTGLLAVSPAFLYARFGWAILPLVANFAQRRDVRVAVFNEDTATWETTTAGAFAARKAAASTPTKRRRRSSLGEDSMADRAVVECDAQVTTAKRQCISPPVTDCRPAAEKIETFHKIVAANPEFAWDALGWHPDLDRIQEMREKALQAREPVRHQLEVKRQLEVLEREGVLWEESDSEGM